MKPSARQSANGDFLSTPFVALPYDLLKNYADLGLHAHEMIMLLQILASGQIRGTTELSAQDLGDLCGMSSKEIMLCVERLVREGLLGIGERFDDLGAHVTYFDLQPLWQRLRGKPAPSATAQSRVWRQDPVTMFEEEFGRPLSALECDQIRTWLGTEGYPEWMVVEALRESVLANKYSFKYIDRVLFDWQRNQIKSRQDLDQYRQQHRDRNRDAEARKRPASTQAGQNYKSNTVARGTSERTSESKESSRDERYANFYQLFPES
ncbi:DnaD domain-containing protein [Alicyclobacillus fastidiosus]|uniref:DnaD domain protein n=1 Tax=Alicyclobacillus fastidiosus TaxID=392011 RepID=A0ABV5AAW3_9BACL|nr:DnaD domain protein [Alicyclobacillus fastidiosus]WEH11881.1 DnaD domain protein [Alicyclobacillus fastidiosus]